MAHSSDTSQFVKTYGKPRLTQRLSSSLWHDNLADDFDKCLGIEDVQHTTFISPESTGSITMYNPVNRKKKIENQMKTINGRSTKLHSTLDSYKSNSTVKLRNIERSTDRGNKKKLFLTRKSGDKKKKAEHFLEKLTDYEAFTLNSNYSYVSSHSKATSTIKKLNSSMLSKEQYFTPLQKSIPFASSSKMNTFSSDVKRKKKKMKRKLAHNFSSPYYSENYPCLNNTNLSEKLNDESVLISGSIRPKLHSKELTSKKDNNENVFLNDYEAEISCKPIFIKNNRFYKNNNWYKEIMTVIHDEESEESCNEKHSDKVVITSNKTLEDYSSESVIIYPEIKSDNIKSLKQQKQLSSYSNSNKISLKLIEHLNKSSSKKENQSIINEHNKSQSYVSCDENMSMPYNSTLYESCYLFDEKEVFGNTTSLNVKHSVDGLKSKKPQMNELETSPLYNNSTETILKKFDPYLLYSASVSDFSNANDSNVKLSNKLALNENNEPNPFINSNLTSHLPVENINFESFSNQINCDTCNFESLTIADVSNSNRNNEENEKYDQFIFEESISKEFDEPLCLSFDKSSSILQSSSNLEQITAIHKQNSTDISSKENVDPNVSLVEKHVLITSSECSSKNILKYNDIILNLSNNRKIDSDHNTLHTLQNSSQDKFDTICHSHSFQFNMNNKLSNSNNSSIINQENFHPINDQLSNLFNQSENNSVGFENISNIKYENNTFTEDHTIVYNTKFDDNLKISQSNLTKNISRQKRYAIRFNNEDVFDENKTEVQNSTMPYLNQNQSLLSPLNALGFRLDPGKKWRRSMAILRSFIDGNLNQTSNCTLNNTKGRKWISTIDDVLRQQHINTNIYQTCNQSSIVRNSMCHSSQRYSQGNSSENEITARKYILEACNQQKSITFKSWLEPIMKKNWSKVGEGVYGEVFSYSMVKGRTVVKIIPVEGKTLINNETQKMLFEVFSEILIATELNKLSSKNSWNQTNSFTRIKNISYVQGKYPEHLIRLWNEYNFTKGSDNDNPNILPNDQLFMILEMEDGGNDLENFVFNSAHQAVFAFLQIVFGLAVAEQQFDFEHRDLHIGNILVKNIAKNKLISYSLNGEIISVPSMGVKITIIDFTLSRMTHLNKPIYNDLSEDDQLFTSDGDYQFEIYRMMRNETNNKWGSYKPKTNIYWLHYLLEKMIGCINFKKTTTIIHNKGLKDLEKLKSAILSFDSAKSYAESSTVLNLLGK